MSKFAVNISGCGQRLRACVQLFSGSPLAEILAMPLACWKGVFIISAMKQIYTATEMEEVTSVMDSSISPSSWDPWSFLCRNDRHSFPTSLIESLGTFVGDDCQQHCASIHQPQDPQQLPYEQNPLLTLQIFHAQGRCCHYEGVAMEISTLVVTTFRY